MALRDLLVRIRGDKTQLDSTLKGAGGDVNKFSETVKKLGGYIAAAFGVQAIVNFTKEAVKLAAQVEGIKKGFEQIATPGLLDELRKATKGTVSDMQLMSRAVQANNFQIPLKDLSKLLEFASARAIQTGQSVDYLVDSIVLGIGRKSPLILDNLGISAVRLRQLLKGTGVEMTTVGQIAEAVGQIAVEELDKMGGMAETSAVKIQQISSAWASVKTGIGKAILESEAFKRQLDKIMRFLNDINELQAGPEGRGETVANDEISFLNSKFTDRKDVVSGLMVLVDQYGNSIDDIRKDNVELANQLSETWNPFKIKDFKDQIKANKDEIIELTTALNIFKKSLESLSKLPPNTVTEQVARFVPGKTNELTPKVGKSKFDADTVGLTHNFINGISETQKLAGAPNITPDAKGKQMIAEANADLRDMVSEMEEILTSGRDMAIDLGGQIVEGLMEAMSGGDTDEIGKSLLSSFANFLSQFGKMLLVAGLGIEAFVKSTATLNAPLAIAAGIAMMAAAGAVRGIIGGASKQVASGGSGGGHSSSASMKDLKIQIEGKLKGKDIYWSTVRYVEDN